MDIPMSSLNGSFDEDRPFGEKIDEVNIADIIEDTIFQYIQLVMTEKYKYNEAVQRVGIGSKMLFALTDIKSTGAVYTDLKEAFKKIKQTKLIRSPKIRANIVANLIKFLQKHIILSDEPEKAGILLNIAIAVTSLSKEIDFPFLKPADTEILEKHGKFIRKLLEEGVIPKSVDIELTQFSRSNPLCKPFFDDIEHRLKRNSNAVIIFEGPHGMGKSYAMLKFAQEFYPKFNVEEMVKFNSGSFSKMAQDLHNKGVGKIPICWDEMGANAASVDGMTYENGLVSKFIQLTRYWNFIYMATAKEADDIFKSTRKRFTHKVKIVEEGVCEIYKIVEKNNKVFEVPYSVEETYTRVFPVYQIGDVDDETAKKYETTRTKEIGEDQVPNIIAQLEEVNKFATEDAMIEEIINSGYFEEYPKNDKGKWDLTPIKAQFRCGDAKAHRLIKKAEERANGVTA